MSRNLTLNGIRRSIHFPLMIAVISDSDCDVSYWKTERSQVILWRGGCVQLLQSCVGICYAQKQSAHTFFLPPKSGALYKPLSPKNIAPDRNIFFAAIRFISEHNLCYRHPGPFPYLWLLSTWLIVTMGVSSAVSSCSKQSYSALQKKSHKIGILPGKRKPTPVQH